MNNFREETMPCIPSFSALRNRLRTVSVNGRSKIDNTYDEIIDLVKLLLRGADFDEKWYLSKYPDVADAVKAGVLKSGRHHFIEVGYFEGRRPREFDVDEKWYTENYPDVAEGIARKTLKSARQHFNEHGYDEGRLPAKW
jgi:hypothetical protein